MAPKCEESGLKPGDYWGEFAIDEMKIRVNFTLISIG